ncbi:MAG: hypothetical protein SH856_13745 [Flavobacteriales bacterium]|nr:hypothetical protein [Flavobacteriales bacterium]
MFHNITFLEMCNLVTNLLNDSNLMNVARTNALGGHISVQNFYAPAPLAPFGGTLNWLCWKNGRAVAEIFIASEKGVAYDPSNKPAAPVSTTLYRNSTFTYAGAIDQASVAAYLQGHTHAMQADTPMTRIEVAAVSGNNFLNHLPGNMPGNNYLDYAFAFFADNDTSIATFLAQTPGVQYLRYYFGMSIISGVKGLKVILVPLDASGRNITSQGGVGVWMLERAWPPRPYPEK